MKSRFFYVICICVVLLIGLYLSSRFTESGESLSYQVDLETLLLRSDDVPQQWSIHSTRIRDMEAKRAFYLQGYMEEAYFGFGEYVWLFDSAEDAHLKFEEYTQNFSSSFFPTKFDWNLKADEFNIQCLNETINKISYDGCFIYARYDDIIILVSANIFEDTGLTYAQFQQVVENAEERVLSSGIVR